MDMKSFFNILFRSFKKFSLFIQSIINTILLSIVYVIGVGLVSLFYKISNRKYKINRNTYWEDYKDSKDNYRLF